MERHVENEPEPWAGLRQSLVRLLDTERRRRMSKKSIHDICEMDTIQAWQTTLNQLPKTKLPESRYDALVAFCNNPYTLADTPEDAVELLRMTALHFKGRYEKQIGSQKQNATLNWLAATVMNMILDGEL